MLFGTLLTQATVCLLVIAPGHVVLAPMVDEVVMLLLMCLSLLGSHPLPLLILLLMMFAGSIFLVLLLAFTTILLVKNIPPHPLQASLR